MPLYINMGLNGDEVLNNLPQYFLFSHPITMALFYNKDHELHETVRLVRKHLIPNNEYKVHSLRYHHDYQTHHDSTN